MSSILPWPAFRVSKCLTRRLNTYTHTIETTVYTAHKRKQYINSLPPSPRVRTRSYRISHHNSNKWKQNILIFTCGGGAGHSFSMGKYASVSHWTYKPTKDTIWALMHTSLSIPHTYLFSVQSASTSNPIYRKNSEIPSAATCPKEEDVSFRTYIESLLLIYAAVQLISGLRWTC